MAQRYTAADYLAQAIALLPSGAAWARGVGSTLRRLLAAQAEELARIDQRIGALREEADPSTAVEMLGDWEQTCGLPDGCVPLAETIEGRQADVVEHLTKERGQSRAYMIGLAEERGWPVSVEEFRPWLCGRARCGQDRLRGPGSVRHTWKIHGLTTSETKFFRLGKGRCGKTRLGEMTHVTDVECRIKRAAPAHTRLYFHYRIVPPRLLLSDGTPILLSDARPVRLASAEVFEE